MRILHIIDNINIDAGVAAAVMNIYRKIDRSEYQFDFLVSHHGYRRGKTFEEEILHLGGQIFYFGAPLSKELFSSLHKSKQFFKLRTKDYDIIHLHTPTIAEFTIKYAKRYGAQRIIVHSHSAMTSTNKIKALVNKVLTCRISKLANYYWACSTPAARFLFGAELCQNNKVTIINNAIFPEKFLFDDSVRDSTRLELGLDHKYVLVHVSNYSPIKNILFFEPIIMSLIKHNDSFHFVFIGNGCELPQFKRDMEKLGLDKFCSFVGETDNVSKYLQAADAFFMPSIIEGFGIAAVEAQAAGLPCFLSVGIPKDVEVGLVKYIPLEENEWVTAILNSKSLSNAERIIQSKKFDQSKLNVNHQIILVQNCYNDVMSADIRG